MIDKGITLNSLDDWLKKQKPASIFYFVLVVKNEHKKLNFKIEYHVLCMHNLGWLVGLGMDNEEEDRGFKFVYEI